MNWTRRRGGHRGERREMSQRARFAVLVGALCAVEAAIVFTLLGWDGVAQLYRTTWDMITWW